MLFRSTGLVICRVGPKALDDFNREGFDVEIDISLSSEYIYLPWIRLLNVINQGRFAVITELEKISSTLHYSEQTSTMFWLEYIQPGNRSKIAM